MSFFGKLFGGGEDSKAKLERANAAHAAGDLNGALVVATELVDADPKNIAAHMLIAKSFWKGKRFASALQVLGALVVTPAVRGNAPIDRAGIDKLVVNMLLSWGIHIESNAFPTAELEAFAKAVQFYCGDRFGGVRTVEIIGLDEGLQRKRKVTATFAEMLRTPN